MNPLAGVALKVLSTIAFTGMATMVKLVSDVYPVGQITFCRSLFALIPVFAWVAWRRQFATVFRTDDRLGHFGRSLIGITAMTMGFLALSMLPLADATAIGYASPLLTVVLAAILLGERVRIYRWTAVAVGFAGVLLIIFDYAAAAGSGAAQPEHSLQGVALQLGAAFFGALAGIQIRRLSRTESAPTIVLYFTLFCTLAALVTVPFGWAVPSPRDAVILVVMGLFGGLGQVLMTQSFRYAEASVLAPFDYLSMIWALAVSIAVFDSLPTPLMLAGTAIVVASGLFVVYRERQLGLLRQRARQVQPPPPPLT